MTIYVGNTLIKYIKNTGIYYGNQPISKVYKGSQLLYEVTPYDTDETVYNKSGSGTTEFMLDKGVYMFYLTAGGGWFSIYYAWGGYYAAYYSGKSGASFEGEFYNPVKQSCKIVSGGGSGESSMTLGGVKVITCQGGGAGSGNPNMCTVTNLQVLSGGAIPGNTQGNGAGHAAGQSTWYGATSNSTYGWGCGGAVRPGQSNAGGAKLVYKRPSI